MTDAVPHGVRLTEDKVRLREFRISTMMMPSSMMTG